VTALYNTAIHEAAHAVIAVKTAPLGRHGLAKNGFVSIEAKGKSLGFSTPKLWGSGKLRRERSIVISFSGPTAQCRVSNNGY
jgi:hypothetical protein